MKFKPYEEYKKVDLPWIDEIPSHWGINRIKDSINYNTNGYWGEEPEGNKHDHICIRVADFDMKKYSVIKNKKLTKRNIRLDNNDRRFLRKGDLLIEKSGGGEKQPVGRVIQYNMKEKAVCSNFISKINIDNKNINSKYILFLLNNIWDTRHIMPYIKQTTGIQNLDDKSFFSNYIQIPPKEEQDKIADFLDHNLAKIDKFVELTERQIELLKEQKEVIINDTVTKGIDKNVEYKDSGIDWIGEIPEHWEVVRLKSIVENIVSGVWGEDSKNDDNDIICIRVADFDMKKLSASKNKLTLRNIDFDKNKSRILKKGDLLLEKSGGGEKQPVGRVIQYKFEEKAVCSNFITKFTPKKLVSSKFLLFTLHNIQLRRRHIAFINQTTGIQNLDINKYFSNKILFPPKKEQEEIVAYIEKETNKIDRTIELYKNQIELIKEYRTSLIASAVTGKIDVRDF